MIFCCPIGKHDGTVQGVTYFTCKPKHGIFVKMDKVILDKKGRTLHNKGSGSNQSDFGLKNSMRRSQSKAEGISDSGKRYSSSGWCLFFFNQSLALNSLQM